MPQFFDENSFLKYLSKELNAVTEDNTELFSFIAVKEANGLRAAEIGFNEVKPISDLDINGLPKVALERIRRTQIPISMTTISYQGSGNIIKSVHLVLLIDFNQKIFRELGRVWSDYSDLKYDALPGTSA